MGEARFFDSTVASISCTLHPPWSHGFR